ncbi:hypothetical protein GLA29479_626 [Lysobacter antibioticus]|uniref:Uncharacterized protein n=1 Tax=Lysobacter antibioticus TaxID=84531 RepID=A0A0S2F8N8_LYSAN|nr:hypothetical protein GLA29479_626 [Lysobacter antibioticus]ALN79805.1 hypothetical protein LA76x_1649 [Lysobacter antibioticus]
MHTFRGQAPDRVPTVAAGYRSTTELEHHPACRLRHHVFLGCRSIVVRPGTLPGQL